MKDKITVEKRHPQTAVKADLYRSRAASLPATATFLFPGRLYTYRIDLQAVSECVYVCVYKLKKVCIPYISSIFKLRKFCLFKSKDALTLLCVIVR